MKEDGPPWHRQGVLLLLKRFANVRLTLGQYLKVKDKVKVTDMEVKVTVLEVKVTDLEVEFTDLEVKFTDLEVEVTDL